MVDLRDGEVCTLEVRHAVGDVVNEHAQQHRKRDLRHARFKAFRPCAWGVGSLVLDLGCKVSRLRSRSRVYDLGSLTSSLLGPGSKLSSLGCQAFGKGTMETRFWSEAARAPLRGPSAKKGREGGKGRKPSQTEGPGAWLREASAAGIVGVCCNAELVRTRAARMHTLMTAFLLAHFNLSPSPYHADDVQHDE
eukprot:210214-Chlamydomonas_euryale.AAC.1